MRKLYRAEENEIIRKTLGKRMGTNTVVRSKNQQQQNPPAKPKRLPLFKSPERSTRRDTLLGCFLLHSGANN